MCHWTLKAHIVFSSEETFPMVIFSTKVIAFFLLEDQISLMTFLKLNELWLFYTQRHYSVNYLTLAFARKLKLFLEIGITEDKKLLISRW